MKIAEARRIAEAALAKAAEMDKSIAVCVVDASGWVVLTENHNEREAFAAYSAESKAVTSAMMGRDSVGMIGTIERYPGLAAPLQERLSGRFLAMGGGVLIKRGGEIYGAVGIAGSGQDTDHEIATQAAEAIDS